LIDLIIKRLLSMPDELNREVFFLLDEVASLNMLPALLKGLTKGRSKGGRIILATQDPFQLQRRYGEDGVHIIESSCGNRVTFSVSGKTAEREADLNIGTAEISSPVRNSSISDEKNSSTNIAEHIFKDSVLLPDELALQKLEGLVKLEGYPFVKSRWPKKFWKKYPQIHTPFILRKGFSLAEVRQRAMDEAKLLSEQKTELAAKTREEKRQAAIDRAEIKALGEMRAKERIEADRARAKAKEEAKETGNVVHLKK
jgi:type IV secretory pathway TraG/TraD family ATPase VirD4